MIFFPRSRNINRGGIAKALTDECEILRNLSIDIFTSAIRDFLIISIRSVRQLLIIIITMLQPVIWSAKKQLHEQNASTWQETIQN